MTIPPRTTESEQRHYGETRIGERILEALAAAGKDMHRLVPDDLAPIDEFHTRGREATRDLARAARLQAGERVLDVGSGLGGPSRRLAAEFGCHVVGIDVTPAYCEAATLLAEHVGLAHRVTYRQGDAAVLPFEDAAFDVVWTQHVAMNVADKQALYRGMHRVLAPGGRLAIYDVLAGPVSPLHFPVPWASSPDQSFLVTPDALCAFLQEAGFVIEAWVDTTPIALASLERQAARSQAGPPAPLGLHLLLGPQFAAMARNHRRNLQENRASLAQLVARK